LIRERREALGWTRQHLATRVGCAINSLAQLETGYSPKTSRVRDEVERVLAEAERAVAA
jgi:transcriptional regulator with XRE-family HTH domain